MSDNRQEIESRGHDVESAIQTGLETLGVEIDDVLVDIVDEGSRGLLGIGSRDAVVRLTLLAERKRQAAEPKGTALMEGVESEAAPLAPPVAEADVERVQEDSEVQLVETAVNIVEQLLRRMQIVAKVSARLSEPDDLTGRQIYVLDIKGNDLGILIGPRGETLNAVQHICRLMVGHQLRHRVDFVIDIQGYRQRREKALARLAERMAKKVSSQQRAISLEPMPPNERRIIHITLRDDEQVYTQSTGEGKRRRVRILPQEHN